MNVFVLDLDPKECAKLHCDKHVVKMIVEYAQLLSTAHRLLDGTLQIDVVNGRKKKTWQHPVPDWQTGLYAATHYNHPSAVWARKTSANYHWLVNLFHALCDEYKFRYGKVHATDSRLRGLLTLSPKNIDRSEGYAHSFALAISKIECIVQGNPVASYQSFYRSKEERFTMRWTKRDRPSWMDLR